jgi:hypothetical protein
MVALAVIAGIVAFLVSRSGGQASPGVAHLGSTPPTGGQSSSQGAGPSGGSTSGRGVAGMQMQLDGGQKGRSSMLKFSACMRSHGVPDFPDPNAQGGISISVHGDVSGSDLDPNSPRFKAAQQACAKLMPGGNLTPAQLAQARAQALKMSACMRSHGIPDFPDPSAGGGIEIQMHRGSDLDPSSPRFQAAQKACQPGGAPPLANGSTGKGSGR